MIYQVQPTKEFPLVIEFTMAHPRDVKRIQAGFRNYAHFVAYKSQIAERNGVLIIDEREIRSLQ